MMRILKRAAENADARNVIELHRIQGNGSFIVNADLIESVEATPDTVITLVTKRRFVVRDSVAEVIDRVVDYRAKISARANGMSDTAVAARASSALIEVAEGKAA